MELYFLDLTFTGDPSNENRLTFIVIRVTFSIVPRQQQVHRLKFEPTFDRIAWVTIVVFVVGEHDEGIAGVKCIKVFRITERIDPDEVGTIHGIASLKKFSGPRTQNRGMLGIVPSAFIAFRETIM